MNKEKESAKLVRVAYSLNATAIGFLVGYHISDDAKNNEYTILAYVVIAVGIGLLLYAGKMDKNGK